MYGLDTTPLVVINCGISGFGNWPIGHYLIRARAFLYPCSDQHHGGGGGGGGGGGPRRVCLMEGGLSYWTVSFNHLANLDREADKGTGTNRARS